MAEVVEKVFYGEKKDFLDQELLKLQGYQYDTGATLGTGKDGYYALFKADADWFKKKEVKEALKSTKEITGKEKDNIIKKMKEIEDNAAGGIALFD